MKKYRLPLACALVVLLSLALPFAVFSLWDKALLSAPHSQTAAEGLSAEARANSTACTLYACSHVLNVPLGYNSGSENPWAQTACQSPGRLHPKRQSHNLERRHRPRRPDTGKLQCHGKF